jgi:nitroimidazol reductase NimA-like FMN-containing flavoprotein (pyridoxamine 5'-phosphate oxidase superfamily)
MADDGEPYVVPVNYGYADGIFLKDYFSCGSNMHFHDTLISSHRG